MIGGKDCARRTETHCGGVFFDLGIKMMSQKDIMTQCPLIRGSKSLKLREDMQFCDLGSQRYCRGEIRLCRNPDALREFLIRVGLGWRPPKKEGPQLMSIGGENKWNPLKWLHAILMAR
jgi:hypothetical protein